MTDYWLSTPRFTCCVRVDTQGVIRWTAPYLRRWWQGHPWDALVGQMRRQYGMAEVQVVALPQAVRHG